MRVGLIGECMVELSPDTDNRSVAKIAFAGDMLNMAVYLKRSAKATTDVAFITRNGVDVFSNRMMDFFRSENLNVNYVSRHPSRLPGLYAIELDPHGERHFSYWRDQSAARTMFDGDQDGFSALGTFDVLALSAITLAILPQSVRSGLVEWLGSYRRNGGTVVFDSNYRQRLWPNVDSARTAIEQMWRCCDIALPSLDDEIELFGDRDAEAVLTRLRSYGIVRGALKAGSSGPRPIAQASVETSFPAATNVVDTTAAGDSFNGAYLAALLANEPDEVAMAVAHKLALCVIRHRGAIVPASVTACAI